MNLYFLRLAKMMAVKEERREGHSNIEPSWIASHIYKSQPAKSGHFKDKAYCLCASVEYGCTVEVLVVFDSIAVLNDALGTAIIRRGATYPLHQHRRILDWSGATHSSDVSAVGCICMRIEREQWSPGRVSYNPSTLRAESSSLSWLILMCASAA